MDSHKEIEILRKENAQLKTTINWYKKTYEERSFWGLQKQYILRKIRQTPGFIARLWFIRNRYLLVHILTYISKYGYADFSKSFKLLKKIYGLKTLLKNKPIILNELIHAKVNFDDRVLNYKVKTTNTYNAEELKTDIAHFATSPKISFILPVFNTKPELLKIAISSICEQVYTNWEVCIVDDCSTTQETKALLTEYRLDPRFRIKFLYKNSGISEASNEAIKMATGDFLALMDHDDEITPDALYYVVKKINESPDADIIYTDECKVDEEGDLSDKFLKPDWSPELLFNMMYVAHLTVYRKPFLDNEVGYFRKEFDFSQDYDLMLRATEKTKGIYHIKKILYHWRVTQGSAANGDKNFARQTNLAALGSAMKRRGIDANIIELPVANRAKINFNKKTGVSIIIPSDSFDNIQTTIESIIKTTTYRDYEIVVVTNSEIKTRLEKLRLTPRLVVETYDKPFNFSDKCNQGVKRAKGEIVIIYNDDVRPIDPEWLENLIEFLFIEGVGGVSPKLLYENDTIQYAGMITGVRRLTGTSFHCSPKDSGEYMNYQQLVRNVSILTGACLAIRKEVFLELGGFDEVNTPIMGSDDNLSFKLLEKGLRCVYTPYACLRHIGHLALGEHDKKQLNKNKDKSDIFLLKRWGKYLSEDRYFTDPMRNLLYRDSPEPFKLYAPDEIKDGRKGDILLIGHELSASGAPIVLFNLCKLLLSEGYFVTIVSELDGKLRDELLKMGVPVIIDSLVFKQHDSLTAFAKNFDFVICNTIITWPVVMQIDNLVKTIWWIHESRLITILYNNVDFIKTITNAKNVICASDYSISFISKFRKDITKIVYGSEDTALSPTSKINGKTPNSKLVFSVLASIEKRKGQDILLDSLAFLPPEDIKKIEVHIVGRTLEPDFENKLRNTATKNNGGVLFTGEQNYQQYIKMVDEADIIVCPSRDDAFPLVLIDSFCKGKPCIVSTNTGTAELINDGENGFIFKSDEPQELAKKISYIIKNTARIKDIGINARKIFDDNMQMKDFKKKWLHFMNSIT
jgi:glycosyltransferase involved in cell wall biosynthesis